MPPVRNKTNAAKLIHQLVREFFNNNNNPLYISNIHTIIKPSAAISICFSLAIKGLFVANSPPLIYSEIPPSPLRIPISIIRADAIQSKGLFFIR